jgi:dipeptidyl-peptidase 4
MLNLQNENPRSWLTGLTILLLSSLSPVAHGFQSSDNRVVTPNFRQAEQYSSAYLRQFVYSTSVTPNWIGKSDEFWYSYKTSEGTRYWRVNPDKETRLPLFDHQKLAGQLSVLTRKPVEPGNLQLTQVELDNDTDKLKFVVEQSLFEYSLKSETLAKLGPAPRQNRTPNSPRPSTQREEQQERREEQQERREEQQERREDQQERREDQQEQQRDGQQRDGQQTQRRGFGEREGDSGAAGATDRSGYRVFSPDRKHYVFAKGHNLYLVTIPPKPEESQPLPGEQPPAEAKAETTDENQELDQKVQQDQNGQLEQTENQQTEESQTDSKQDKTEQTQTEQTQTESQQTQTNETKTTQTDSEQTKTEETQTDKTQTDKTQTDKTQTQSTQSTTDGGTDTPASQSGEPPIPEVDPALDDLAVQLSTDGVADYSFAGRVIPTRGGNQQTQGNRSAQGAQGTGASEITDETKTRPSVVWSEDSQAFYVNRRDSRGVKDLWVINSLASPRPTLESYPYPMPGEDNIRKTEMYWFSVTSKQLQPLTKKWKDESYSNIRYSPDHTQLQFLRRDRLLRNVEYCSLHLGTGAVETMFEEGFDQASISPQPPRFLKDSQEFIWWSERDGWGHYYLYGSDGQFKNQITSGPYIAARILDVDEQNRIMYFYGNAREPGENLNYQHLYSIRLDGGDLKLLDPGDANHTSILSPSKKYLIDNYSRVDMAPEAVLRRADGAEVMPLEKTDLSRLYQTGWQMPETFVVKAADGVTDLYGNMYKPFDFDPNRKYPIITYVYPGPQQEGTRHTFAATSGEQQLAQIGFVVVQVGHRGGTPRRSKAYASYGYFNLRDYGLADKKTAIEQLGQIYSFVDVERVGIYGHSGGGFMTAAALMVPPYNDFFKAGFSTAGNHDNNIYNNAWSERWHGMREVAVSNNSRGQNTARPAEAADSRQSSNSANTLNLQVDPEDFFYDFEVYNGEDPWDFDERLREGQFDAPDWNLLQQDLIEKVQEQQVQEQQVQEQQVQEQQQENQDARRDNQEGQRGREGRRQRGRRDSEREGQERQVQQQTDVQQDSEKQQDGQNVENKDGTEGQETKQEQEQKDGKQDAKQQAEQQTRFEIRVPTNAELAANLKHHLFLVHGELDNNVHPANTLRLVDALIKANKRFDMLYLPGTRHGFGDYQPYVTQRMFEFFAQRLLSDYQTGADMKYNR